VFLLSRGLIVEIYRKPGWYAITRDGHNSLARFYQEESALLDRNPV